MHVRQRQPRARGRRPRSPRRHRRPAPRRSRGRRRARSSTRPRCRATSGGTGSRAPPRRPPGRRGGASRGGTHRPGRPRSSPRSHPPAPHQVRRSHIASTEVRSRTGSRKNGPGSPDQVTAGSPGSRACRSATASTAIWPCRPGPGKRSRAPAATRAASTSRRTTWSIRSASWTIAGEHRRALLVAELRPAPLERVAEALHRGQGRTDVVRGGGDDVLECSAHPRDDAAPTRTGTRWPRPPGSATPRGPRAGREPWRPRRDRTSSGSPCASFPNDEGDRSGEIGGVEALVTHPASMASTRRPARRACRRSGARRRHGPRGGGTAIPPRPAPSSGCRSRRVVAVKIDPAGARRVGRTEHRPGVPWIADLVQDDDAAVGRAARRGRRRGTGPTPTTPCGVTVDASLRIAGVPTRVDVDPTLGRADRRARAAGRR